MSLRLSQSRLAILVGISRNRLSQFECGYSALHAKEVQKIERVLVRLEAVYLQVEGQAKADGEVAK